MHILPKVLLHLYTQINICYDIYNKDGIRIMKTTQADLNPYKHSNTNKRYYTYDHYLKSTFGKKVAKIPLDCGFTCPNIDGTKGVGGCIYCSERGSGDFAGAPSLSIPEQYYAMFDIMKKKWDTDMAIPYFQAHTNTYSSAEHLRSLYHQALSLEGVVGMNIATRADCLPDDILYLLSEIADKTVLTVELGLQSVHDSTGKLINRCHSFNDFCRGYHSLREASKKINICVHLIEGLPGETHSMMLDSAREVAKLRPEQIKLHCLNVLKNTALERMYSEGKYTPLSIQEYVDVICDSLELICEDTVIGRLTGDADRSMLVAPAWSTRKTEVINNIDKELHRRNTYQGIYFQK